MDEENPDNISEYSDEDVKKILKNSLRSKLKAENTQLPNRKEVYKALSSYMSEFMACYKLIGYDLEGHPVKMKFYSNKLEEDALTHAFLEDFGEFISNEEPEE